MLTQKILLQFEPKKENILRALKAIQKEEGMLTRKAIGKVAEYFSISLAQIYSVASFYDQLVFEKEGVKPIEIKICDGANCMVKGGDKVAQEIENFFGQRIGDSFNTRVRIKRESCLGLCLSGPVMVVNETVFEKISPEKVDEILKGYLMIDGKSTGD